MHKKGTNIIYHEEMVFFISPSLEDSVTTLVYRKDTLEMDKVTTTLFLDEIMKTNDGKSHEESTNVASCSNRRRGRSKKS